MRAETQISERRACSLMGISRTVFQYRPTRDESIEQLKSRIIALAQERCRFGYRRIHIMLKHEGIRVNHKRTYRLFKEAGLAVKKRRKRHGVAVPRQALTLPSGPNQIWSMDFVFDALSTGKRIKCLTIVDDYTKEAVDIVVDRSISGHYVARALSNITRFRGTPQTIRTDQGPEFTDQVLDQWATDNGVELRLIQAGKPTQNAFIESFNGKFRDECLNEHWFHTMDHAKVVIAAWRRDYNEYRPHSSLGKLTPSEFATLCRKVKRMPEKAMDARLATPLAWL